MFYARVKELSPAYSEHFSYTIKPVLSLHRWTRGVIVWVVYLFPFTFSHENGEEKRNRKRNKNLTFSYPARADVDLFIVKSPEWTKRVPVQCVYLFFYIPVLHEEGRGRDMHRGMHRAKDEKEMSQYSKRFRVPFPHTIVQHGRVHRECSCLQQVVPRNRKQDSSHSPSKRRLRQRLCISKGGKQQNS